MKDDAAQPWPCPACNSGTLRLEKGSLNKRETRDSIKCREGQEPGEWEPDVPFYRFACVLLCNQPQCGEPVIVSGHTTDEPGYGPEGESTWEHFLNPVFFHQPPPIIRIPDDCPKEVRHEINTAFALYWCDRLSCANRLRNAIELLLTHLRIRRFQAIPGKHKRQRLTLHQRIELFSQRSPDLATRMFAVKWVGNEGSHPGKLTQDDLLDAFEILEDMFKDLFVSPEKNRILEMAKTIHRSKRPRSHLKPKTGRLG